MCAHVWVYAAAGFNVAMAGFHLCFWRLCRWREELPKLHPANRGVMQVMNIMLTALLLLLGGLQLLLPLEIATSTLGRLLMTGLALCWLLRACLQHFFRRAMSTAANAVFTGLFLLGAGLHILALKP